MYYSAIGLLAAGILLIENRDIFLNSGGEFEKPAWNVYRKFLCAVFVYYITDIAWGILESHRLAVLLFADTTVYFAAMAAGVLFWAQFIVDYLENNDRFGRALVYAGRILAGTIILLAAVNIFIPLLFTVDDSAAYRALPLRYVLLICQIVLLLLISVYASVTMRSRNADDSGAIINSSLPLFGLIMAVCLFAQLWFPYLPLYAIAYMLGTSLLHTFVAGDEKERYRRELEEAAEITEFKDTISALLDNMPGMTFTKDAVTGEYLACNQAFARFAHRSGPEAVIGRTAAEIFDPVKAKRFADDDKIALSMDQPYIYYEDTRDAAGRKRQLQVTKIKYRDVSERQCVLGIFQDVTDIVRIQREDATTKEAYEKARSTGIIYTHIAQALARGYSFLYYVNLDSEEFVQYRTQDEGGILTEARRGWHFFEEAELTAERLVHPDDRAAVLKAMERKTLVAALDREKIFVITFRYASDRGTIYVSMRISRMEDDDRYIVIGITDIDSEMKQKRFAERMQEEQIAYARLNALTGVFLCIYIVEPESGRYREFSSTAGYGMLSQQKEGVDFFATAREAAYKINHPDDLNRFLSSFTKERVMAEIEANGIFTTSYRIILDDKPLYVQLRAAVVEEKDGARMIVGINDIDSQVRQEEEYLEHLARARMKASVDALTGVKNRHAYLMAEERINVQISEGHSPEYAIVILDINDLKKINDTQGHNAGDRYIMDACRIICNIFKHSPVFRIGGDEFAVIAQGADFECIDELTARVYSQNEDAMLTGGIVIACGMAKSENDESVADVFERADQNMYENKNRLKSEKIERQK